MKELSLQNDFYRKAGARSIVPPDQKSQASNVLQRVAAGDQTAAKDCIDKYGALIWSIAKKLTSSDGDAEAVTQEIFLNIWHYAARFEQTGFSELLFIMIIARRQIRVYLEKTNQSIKSIN